MVFVVARQTQDIYLGIRELSLYVHRTCCGFGPLESCLSSCTAAVFISEDAASMKRTRADARGAVIVQDAVEEGVCQMNHWPVETITSQISSPSGYRATSSNGIARCYLISQLSASWACRSMVEFDALWLCSEQEGMLLPVMRQTQDIYLGIRELSLCTYTDCQSFTERLWFRTTRKLS